MLTKKQESMLNLLINHFQHHDVAPSFEELCDVMGLKSKSGIHRLLLGLEERGYIRRLPNKARAIDVLKYPDGSARHHNQNAALQPSPETAENTTDVTIPLLGKIAAGTPITAISDPTGSLAMPQNMVGGGTYYALEVEGDSMIDAGILDGDTVIIKQQDTAENGDVVVALIDEEEATLKRLRRRGGSIALEAANPAYETRIFGPDRVRIQGKLAGLLRQY